MEDMGLLPIALRDMLLGDDEVDFIYHFNGGTFNEEVDEDFIYTYFNGKRRRSDQRPNVTRSRLNYKDGTPVVVYEQLKPTGKARTAANELLQPSGYNIDESRTDVSCPVCMASEREIVSSGGNFVVTYCGHVFCNQCMEEILRRSKECPTCRKNVSQETNMRIYFSGANMRDSNTLFSCPTCEFSVADVNTCDKYFYVALCCHIICSKCIRGRKRCPTCRSSILRSTRRKVFF